jgi:hypothetical protein
MPPKPPPLRLTLCCRTGVIIREIRTGGEPIGHSHMGYFGHAPPANAERWERTEYIVSCWNCGKAWAEPMKLVRGPGARIGYEPGIEDAEPLRT